MMRKVVFLIADFLFNYFVQHGYFVFLGCLN